MASGADVETLCVLPPFITSHLQSSLRHPDRVSRRTFLGTIVPRAGNVVRSGTTEGLDSRPIAGCAFDVHPGTKLRTLGSP